MIRPFTKSFICCIALGISLFFTNQNLVAQIWNQISKVVAADRSTYTNFGNSVAISGDYAIIGAYMKDEYVGGNLLPDVGVAYIFKRTGSTWLQEAKLLSSNRSWYDLFGNSVSIDGDYAIVGAYSENEGLRSGAGAAYIFKRTGTTWLQEAKVVAPDRQTIDEFGTSVAISGNYAIVGAKQGFRDTAFISAGAAYIFKRTGTIWEQEAKIVASDRAAGDRFGHTVAISGDYAIVGARNEGEDSSGRNTLVSAGSAYIFKRTGTGWEQEAKIVASDREMGALFGRSVAISGDYAIVGAFKEDKDAIGVNASTDAGAAYIFKRTGTNWTQEAKIVASDRAALDEFGYSVAINGDVAVVGLPARNFAYVFKRTGTTWTQESKIVGSDRTTLDWFGGSVAINNDVIIVGAESDSKVTTSSDILQGAGSAYFFQRQTTNAVTDMDNHDLKIYPNPVSTTLRIETELGNDYQITNILGQTILRGQITPSATSGIDVSVLASGTYILKIGQEQTKFVKQ
ncbi:MAG: T9SS type A sorting domain-containing protein [Saprospiraceae bacterium]|nr:T9SS type A sorting domain-containing protein [Saprospiraceae bacterium]